MAANCASLEAQVTSLVLMDEMVATSTFLDAYGKLYYTKSFVKREELFPDMEDSEVEQDPESPMIHFHLMH